VFNFGGRLLREDHQAVGRGRAADLRNDAALWGPCSKTWRSIPRRAELDLDDDRFNREHGAPAYPIEFINNAVLSGLGGHPQKRRHAHG